MPYESVQQEKFFEGCRSNPSKMKGKCPDRGTLEEYHNAEYHGFGSYPKKRKGKKKR